MDPYRSSDQNEDLVNVGKLVVDVIYNTDNGRASFSKVFEGEYSYNGKYVISPSDKFENWLTKCKNIGFYTHDDGTYIPSNRIYEMVVKPSNFLILKPNVSK